MVGVGIGPFFGPLGASGGVANPTITAQTPVAHTSPRSSGLGPDGYTWDQGKNPVVDSHNQIVVFGQRFGGNIYSFLSSDEGLTMTDPTETGWQNAGPPPTEVGSRCSIAFDPVDDCYHVLFMLTGFSTDAMIYYRRFFPTRDGSGNITALTKDAAINLFLDVQHAAEPGASAVHPIFMWMRDDATAEPHGKLVAIWGVNEDTGSAVSTTIRASQLILAMTAADGVAANWRTLSGGSTVAATSAQKPNVPTTEIFYKNPGSYIAYQSYPAVTRLPNGDFAVAWTVLGEGLYYRKVVYDPVNRDWSEPMTTVRGPVSFGSGGYTLKHEIGAEPVYDPVTNRIYFGYSRYSASPAGDQWAVHCINNSTDDFLAGFPVVVYQSPNSANGATNFVTGSCFWDTAINCLLVAYNDLPNHSVFVTALDADGAVITAAVKLMDGNTGLPFDIPVLLKHVFAGQPTRRQVVGRAFNAGSNTVPPAFSGGPYVSYSLGFTIHR